MHFENFDLFLPWNIRYKKYFFFKRAWAAFGDVRDFQFCLFIGIQCTLSKRGLGARSTGSNVGNLHWCVSNILNSSREDGIIFLCNRSKIMLIRRCLEYGFGCIPVSERQSGKERAQQQ
jgi:hypothetical protein